MAQSSAVTAVAKLGNLEFGHQGSGCSVGAGNRKAAYFLLEIKKRVCWVGCQTPHTRFCMFNLTPPREFYKSRNPHRLMV